MASECCCHCASCSNCHSSLHLIWILVTTISYLEAHWERMGVGAHPGPSRLYIYRAWCSIICFYCTCPWATRYGTWRFKKWCHSQGTACHLSIHVHHWPQCQTHWRAFSAIKRDHCKVSSMCSDLTHHLIHRIILDTFEGCAWHFHLENFTQNMSSCHPCWIPLLSILDAARSSGHSLRSVSEP